MMPTGTLSRLQVKVGLLALLALVFGCMPAGDDSGAIDTRTSATGQRSVAGAFPSSVMAARNARLLGLERVSFEPVGSDHARISWSIHGFDPGVSEVDVALTRLDGGSTSEMIRFGPGDAVMPLWLTEPVEVRRAPGVLVFGASGGNLDRLLKDARSARAYVLEFFPDWDGKLVIEVPSSQSVLTAALRGQPGAYDGVAAVTSSSDGSRRSDAAVHVFVNSSVYHDMAPTAARIVMTHEVVHVATKAPIVPVPLWWAEGLADYVAFSEVDRRDGVESRELIRRSREQLAGYVLTHGVPDGLPEPEDFAGAGQAAAYESARLACQILATFSAPARLSVREALVELQRRLADGTSEQVAIRRVFGIPYRGFERHWQERLQQLSQTR